MISGKDIQEQYEKSVAEWKKKKANIQWDMLQDEDGYPTEAALELIEEWHWSDMKDYFSFIRDLWTYDYWKEEELLVDDYNGITYSSPRHRYNISTAGWSGNESLIEAMQANHMMWQLSWVQSRRGGHYIFELQEYGDENGSQKVS